MQFHGHINYLHKKRCHFSLVPLLLKISLVRASQLILSKKKTSYTPVQAKSEIPNTSFEKAENGFSAKENGSIEILFFYIFSNFFLDKNFIFSSSRAKFVEEIKDLSFIIDKHAHLKNKNIFKTPVKNVVNEEL